MTSPAPAQLDHPRDQRGGTSNQRHPLTHGRHLPLSPAVAPVRATDHGRRTSGAEYATRFSAPAFPREGGARSSVVEECVSWLMGTTNERSRITKRYARFRMALQEFADAASAQPGRGFIRSRLRKNLHTGPAVRNEQRPINYPANTNRARGRFVRW